MSTSKNYIIPLLFVAAAVGVVVLFINPTLAQVKTNKQNLIKLHDAEQKVAELLGIYDSLRQKYQQISDSDRNAIEKVLPANINNVRLILELQRISESNGMGLRDIDVKLKDPDQSDRALPDNMRVVSVTAEVTGDYKSFLKFMGDIEESLRIITIRRIDFDTTQTTGSLALNSGQHNYKLELETYWFVYPEAQGAVTTPPQGSVDSTATTGLEQ